IKNTAGTGIASFIYDGLERRIQKTVNGVATRYLYDRLNPVQELDGANAVKANLWTGPKIDEFISRIEPARTHHFLTDALGSTRALADDAGALSTSYAYDPYGKGTASGEASTNPFQYTGRENDGTGLYYYRARYYHPGAQRFVSEDKIGFSSGSFNLYTYVKNRPVNRFDSLGLEDMDDYSKTILDHLSNRVGLIVSFLSALPSASLGVLEAPPLAVACGVVSSFGGGFAAGSYAMQYGNREYLQYLGPFRSFVEPFVQFNDLLRDASNLWFYAQDAH
ncbi:MAG: RHS repeat-associated core domain-containing protein, partial [Methylococcaceae bacterium]